MDISVVIPLYNEERIFAGTIRMDSTCNGCQTTQL